MTSINFPNNPAANDEYTFLSRTWKYNGVSWEIKPQSLTYNTVINAIGFTPVGNYDGIINNNLSVGGNVSISKNLVCNGSISFPGGGGASLQTANIGNSTTQNAVVVVQTVSVSYTNLSNIVSANIIYSNIGTLRTTTTNTLSADITYSNIGTVNMTTVNIASANIISSNIGQLNVNNAMIHTLGVDSGNLTIGTGTNRIDGSNSNTLIFYANTTEVFRITSNASNVVFGISTANVPNTIFQVGRRVNEDGLLNYATANLQNAVYIISQQNTSATLLNDMKPVMLLGRQGLPSIANGAGAILALSRFENSGTKSRSRLDFILANNSFGAEFNGTLNSSLTIYSTGNVAIGPGKAGTGPGEGVFDIRGTESARHQATLARTPSDENFELRVMNGYTGVTSKDNVATLGVFYKGYGEVSTIKFLRGSEQQDGHLTISTRGIERMAVTNTGNILINRTADSTYGSDVKLDVTGAIRADAIYAGSTSLTGAPSISADTTSTARPIGFVDSTATALTTLYKKADFTYNPGTATLDAPNITINQSSISANLTQVNAIARTANSVASASAVAANGVASASAVAANGVASTSAIAANGVASTSAIAANGVASTSAIAANGVASASAIAANVYTRTVGAASNNKIVSTAIGLSLIFS